MSMFNTTGNYNEKTFLGNSSAKPIAGIVTRILREYGLQEAKMPNEVIAAGSPVKLTNTVDSTNTHAGKKLNPNVLSIAKATKSADVCGFLVANQTDYQGFDEEAPRAVEGQIVDVAEIGSNIEMYLPCDATLANVPLNTKVDWDFANGLLKKAETDASINISILSPVVDGVTYYVDGTSVKMKASKVVKVKL